MIMVYSYLSYYCILMGRETSFVSVQSPVLQHYLHLLLKRVVKAKVTSAFINCEENELDFH